MTPATALAKDAGLLWRRLVAGGGAPPPDETAFMDASPILRTGNLVVGGFIAVFFLWGGLAPLASAVVSPGVVVVESHRKTIQHLEGGIISAVLVEEGQHVKAGQALVKLDETQARANLGSLRDQADALAAQEARLSAERDGRDTIDFPADLMRRAARPSVAQAMAGEHNTFQSYHDTVAKQADILTSRIQQDERIVAGLETERAAMDNQIALIEREIVPAQNLFDQKMDTLQHLLSLKRQKSTIEGSRGEIAGKIAQTRLNIDETRMQIQNVRNERLNTVVDQLRDVQTKRFDLVNRLQAAGDIYNRVTLNAPAAGRVVGLAVHSRGAVVKPGDTLLEIVPDNDQLEVEAHLRPEDADEVYIGMPALVRLTGYRQRRLPVISGKVTEVSADRLTDQRSGQPYFNVLVSVDRSPLQDYPDARLMPGVPIEVALKTGSRTALSYLVEPISDVMHRGMRER
jgi:HlyD family type I secretion membrane fusion protein